MNPLVDDVPGAFRRIAEQPIAVEIDRAGVVLPEGGDMGHFQGIQRLPGEPQRLVITSSSKLQAYFVWCQMHADGVAGRAFAPVTMGWQPFRHCGGCQTFGEVLVAGVEDDAERRTSEVQFWDFKRFPVQLTPMTIPRSGAEKVSTAGAVGMTSHGRGAVVAVATWDARTVDFYVSRNDPFQGAPFVLQFTWTAQDADKTGWIDGNFGNYQTVNLVTQRDGQLFLIGFNRNDSDEDWMDLYQLDLGAPPARALRKLDKKHMHCTNGCSFEKGSGIFIPSPRALEVYAVKGDSGDHRSGTTIHVNHFA
jgi:hypothetical protein